MINQWREKNREVSSIGLDISEFFQEHDDLGDMFVDQATSASRATSVYFKVSCQTLRNPASREAFLSNVEMMDKKQSDHHAVLNNPFTAITCPRGEGKTQFLFTLYLYQLIRGSPMLYLCTDEIGSQTEYNAAVKYTSRVMKLMEKLQVKTKAQSKTSESDEGSSNHTHRLDVPSVLEFQDNIDNERHTYHIFFDFLTHVLLKRRLSSIIGDNKLFSKSDLGSVISAFRVHIEETKTYPVVVLDEMSANAWQFDVRQICRGLPIIVIVAGTEMRIANSLHVGATSSGGGNTLAHLMPHVLHHFESNETTEALTEMTNILGMDSHEVDRFATLIDTQLVPRGRSFLLDACHKDGMFVDL